MRRRSTFTRATCTRGGQQLAPPALHQQHQEAPAPSQQMTYTIHLRLLCCFNDDKQKDKMLTHTQRQIYKRKAWLVSAPLPIEIPLKSIGIIHWNSSSWIVHWNYTGIHCISVGRLRLGRRRKGGWDWIPFSL